MLGGEDLGKMLIGEGLESIRQRVAFLAKTDLMVLILGESGVGKELVALGLAQHSGRPMARFLPINAAVLTDTLAESLLFGHVRGAFTGAVESRDGYLEAARGGTLFLDEIGDLSTSVQAKLLRIVEGKTFNRVGDTRVSVPDTRLILATNADLASLVRRKRFREDLMHRLMEAVIEIPPLRDRKHDIPVLMNHFMEVFARENGLQPVTWSDASLTLARRHPWPGNVRQLRNFVSLVMQEYPGEEITPFRTSAKIRQSLGLRSTGRRAAPTRMEIEGAVREADGNISRASELLGISRRHFYRLMEGSSGRGSAARRSQPFGSERVAGRRCPACDLTVTSPRVAVGSSHLAGPSEV